jgi:CheY-like chemotaxis protein
MDVSLPGGGVELVRSARAASPDLQIVMFSGHDEAAVQADMLAAGADSYVIKTGRLKPLIEALVSGPRPRAGGPPRDGPTPRSHQLSRSIDPVLAGGGDHRHRAFFYGDDRELVPHLAATAAAALAGPGRFMVVATREHRAALRASLPTDMIDHAIGDGRFVDLDADQTLGLFMRRGMPDPILFDRTVGAAIRAQAAGPGHLHAWGEMVSLLWDQGNLIGTLRLEQLWTQLQRSVAFDLVCGYRMTAGQDEAGGGFTAICELHTEFTASHELELRRVG